MSTTLKTKALIDQNKEALKKNKIGKKKVRSSDDFVRTSTTIRRNKPECDPASLARAELDRLVFKDEHLRSDKFNDTLDFALTPNGMIILASFFAADTGALTGGAKVRSFSYDSLAQKLGITRSGVKTALERLLSCKILKLVDVEIEGRVVAFKPALTEFAEENCRSEYLDLRDEA